MSAQESAAILKKIAGTWNSEWNNGRETRNWVIDTEGNVVENGKSWGKAREQAEWVLTFKKQYRVSVEKNGTRQEHVFLFHDGKFYVSLNLLYDVYPVVDQNKFIVKHKRDYVLYDNGECMVINEKGAIASAQGAFEENVFQGSYQYNGEVDGLGRPKVNEFKYYVLGDNLAQKDLIETGMFVKR